ncbi:glycoside hydrolase family 43 protein [Oleiagrimonas sp. C23AA]|uniref:glycoside hydrolase family 43 protein n=1 Tax=Oleiagrimonas sp. C23AA TaxID=2719047 RepID=UPI00141FB4D3|nr:glycoside hydrolase family 43 protein [Oleiagrimonas sp. C23AA]NII09996.1 family 43 glycosylhydrolase [Oleiagrimonas sp. C23AA]
MSSRLATTLAATLATLCATQALAGTETYTNPLLPSGADPWVIRHDGFYYYTNTLGNRIALWKTADMARLGQAKPVVVWRPPASGPGSTSIWAPELHYIDGAWYLYYTGAEKGHDDDAHRHIYVLENTAADPTRGHWVSKGQVNATLPGIDATVFQLHRRWYFVYSAYVDDHSDLILARMKNPWTLTGPQVDIAHPTKPWEMYGGRKIMEAPEFLKGPGDKVFLTYSASACWSDHYALGMLSAKAGADLTHASAWHKSAQPVFQQDPAHGVYATGHNAFFKSPDGSQDWILYHANGGPNWKCTDRRAPRMQPFHWNADGTPDFGQPIRDGVPHPAPSKGS